MMRRLRAIAILLAFVAAACAIFALTFWIVDLRARREEGVLVVGSKQFSESYILAEAFAQLIERETDLRVERRINLGGTQICFEALRAGEIDLYPEYTGTGLMAILEEPRRSDPVAVLERVREVFGTSFGLAWLDPLAFDNTYAMAMTRQQAASMGITTVSDLRRHRDLVVGAPPEFLERGDGWPGLAEVYELGPRRDPVAMDAGLMYQAVATGQVDVVSAYATDARIDKFDLVLLEDDRNFFPPYNAAPLVRQDVLAEHPEVREALLRFGGEIDDATMRKYNGMIDIDKRPIAEVASELLEELETNSSATVAGHRKSPARP